jgi:hypothetical protein
MGRTPIYTKGGSEHITPVQAMVIISGSPPSRQDVTITVGTGKRAVEGPLVTLLIITNPLIFIFSNHYITISIEFMDSRVFKYKKAYAPLTLKCVLKTNNRIKFNIHK